MMLHKNVSHGNFFVRALRDFGLLRGGLALFLFVFRCLPFKIVVRVVWASRRGELVVGRVEEVGGFEKSHILAMR